MKALNKAYFYYLLMVFAGLIGLVKTIIYAKLLGPTQLGHYSLVVLLSTYGISICSCGLYEGASAVFPKWYGEGRKGFVELIRNRIIGFTGILTLIYIVSLWIIWVINPFENSLISLTIFLSGVFSGTSVFFLLILADIRSQMMTIEFGVIMFLRSIFSLLFGILAIIHFKFIGLLVSEITILTLIAILVIHYKIHNFAFEFSKFGTLKPIFRVGFPLMINGIATNTASSIDKFFVLTALGSTMFGQYSFSFLIVTGASLIRGIVYQHLCPSILHQIGQGYDPKALFVKLNRMIGLFIIFLSGLWYPLNWLAKVMMQKFLPEYMPSYSIFYVLYIGASIIIISHYEYFIIALGKSEYLLISNIISLIFSTLLLGIGTLYNWSLMSFAWIFVIGRILYFVITFLLSKWAITKLCIHRNV